MTAARGIAQSEARRELLGTFQVDARMNFGEELPCTGKFNNDELHDVHIP